MKLFPIEMMDVRHGRFFIVNEQSSYINPDAELAPYSTPWSAPKPSLIDFNLGRFDITVDNDDRNAKSPNSIDLKLGRFFISNESPRELGTTLPNDAILIDFNLGSLDNLKYSKLTKLYSSISIDSSLGQFTIQKKIEIHHFPNYYSPL